MNIKDKIFEIVNFEKFKFPNCEFFHSFLKFVFWFCNLVEVKNTKESVEW